MDFLATFTDLWKLRTFFLQRTKWTLVPQGIMPHMPAASGHFYTEGLATNLKPCVHFILKQGRPSSSQPPSHHSQCKALDKSLPSCSPRWHSGRGGRWGVLPTSHLCFLQSETGRMHREPLPCTRRWRNCVHAGDLFSVRSLQLCPQIKLAFAVRL